MTWLLQDRRRVPFDLRLERDLPAPQESHLSNAERLTVVNAPHRSRSVSSAGSIRLGSSFFTEFAFCDTRRAER